jgi:predicted amidohydrolase YtcJ
MQHHCDGTKVVDLKGHTAIPGLNDSHLHLIRGGLNYNLNCAGKVFRHWPMPCGC